jgi:glycosyltransferase involved in cell wall biosynthesis
MSTTIFVILPSFQPTGPIRGAVALCNSIVNRHRVYLVLLKEDELDGSLYIDPRVTIISLVTYESWRKKYNFLKEMMKRNNSGKVVTVSYSFSADCFNFFLKPYAEIISSIRANLSKNYIFDYKKIGAVFAFLHYILLHRFSAVMALSESMERKLRRFGLRRVYRVGNFIDETLLEGYRKGGTAPPASDAYRFLFLASLTPRKNPSALIYSLHALIKKGYQCRVDIIGEGPLLSDLKAQVKMLGIDSAVTFHGYLKSPYHVLQNADCTVIPSYSEGISRAMMESLFFGIPVVARDVDGNSEIITSNVNGELFKKDTELVDAMEKMILDGKEKNQKPANLLPEMFRQNTCIQKMLCLINDV